MKLSSTLSKCIPSRLNSEEVHKLAKFIWNERGFALLDIRDIEDEEVRKSIILVASKKYGNLTNKKGIYEDILNKSENKI